MPSLQVDPEILKKFERGLDPRHPEGSLIPAQVLGYGEISTAFEIREEGLEGIACKRLPIFRAWEEVEKYRAIYEEYHRILQEEVGLLLPSHGHAEFLKEDGRPIFFILQEKLSPASIGNRALAFLDREKALDLVLLILRELRKVWDFNRSQDEVQVAIDGQISNWSIAGFDPEDPHLEADTCLFYLDTSTPLFRVAGVEQLDPELFLRSAPSFLVWIIRLFFLEDVMTRYYHFRLVVIDLIANFYKEQRPELIPDLVALANRFFVEEVPHLDLQPINEKEVASYYREDALIWSLYLGLRKLDRFLRTRILRREYPYILPRRIKRR